MSNKETNQSSRSNSTTSDRMVEYLCILLLILHFGSLLYFFPSMSDSIPIHFDGKGQADGFGSKNTLWFLVAIATGLYILMTYINSIPHHFNYLAKITLEKCQKRICKSSKDDALH